MYSFIAVGNALFRLVFFGSLRNFIKRNLPITLAKLHFYVDYTVGFLWESITTVSTWFVNGNISIG